MKKEMSWVVVAIMVLSLGVNVKAASGKSALTPLISAEPMVKMKKDAKVFIMGSGFRPGQEIKVVYTDPNGVLTNIGNRLKPKPVVDQKGEWSTTWNCGRFVSRKLIKEGVASIMVTDDKYNILAHDSIFFHAE